VGLVLGRHWKGPIEPRAFCLGYPVMSSSDHHKVFRAGAAQLAPTSNLTILAIPLPTTLSPFSAVGAPFWSSDLPAILVLPSPSTNERPSWTMYVHASWRRSLG